MTKEITEQDLDNYADEIFSNFSDKIFEVDLHNPEHVDMLFED